jgi:hypothetical protein
MNPEIQKKKDESSPANYVAVRNYGLIKKKLASKISWRKLKKKRR